MLHSRVLAAAICSILAALCQPHVAVAQDEAPRRQPSETQKSSDSGSSPHSADPDWLDASGGVQATTFREMLASSSLIPAGSASNHRSPTETFGYQSAQTDAAATTHVRETDLTQSINFARMLAEDPSNQPDAEQAFADQPSDDEIDANAMRNRVTAEELERLRKPISQIRIRATADGQRVPENRADVGIEYRQPLLIGSLGIGSPGPNRYMCPPMHRPLYFEQRNLERCGRSYGAIQTAVSAVQFVGNTLLLPYSMCDQRADCLVRAVGDCLACQDCPSDCGLIPVNQRALITEAATLAGFSFLLL